MNCPTSCLPHPFSTSCILWWQAATECQAYLSSVLPSSYQLPFPLALFLLCLLYSPLFRFEQLVIYLVSRSCIITTVDFYGHQYYSPFICFFQDELKRGRDGKTLFLNHTSIFLSIVLWETEDDPAVVFTCEHIFY